LGAGTAADYHRQAVAANSDVGARLAAVGHHDPHRFGEIGSRFGVPCRSYEAILADPAVDVVCVCTPSGQHADQAVAAAQAGKHVLVEKPMALRLDEADRVIAACDDAGVRLGVMLQRRAEPQFQRIRQAIQAGDLGRLTLGGVTMAYHRPQAYYDQAGWRGTWALDGGGVLMNQGIHLVDLLLWYMGDPVETRAQAGTLARNMEVEDTLTATLRFASGALGTITATTTAAPGFPHRVEIYGTEGGIQLEGERVRRWSLSNRDPAEVYGLHADTDPNIGPGSDPKGIAPTGHIAILRDYVLALHTGHELCVDGAEGRRSLACVLDIYRAAGLGR